MLRMYPNTPIEETMKRLLELKNEGKIKYICLSECTPEELERAHNTTPVSVIQIKWSLQTEILKILFCPVARKLEVAIV